LSLSGAVFFAPKRDCTLDFMLLSTDGFGAGDAGLPGFFASAPEGAAGGFDWLFGAAAGFSA
jgi:hypothetical protein